MALTLASASEIIMTLAAYLVYLKFRFDFEGWMAGGCEGVSLLSGQ